MRRDDMQMIVDMFNDPEMESLVSGWAFPLSLEQQNLWFDKHINDQTDLRFVIETPEDGAIGIDTIVDIDWKNRRAFHGLKIRSSNYRGKGAGKDTLFAAMRYAFDELGLHRLDGGWFDTNSVSRNFHLKYGWTEESLRKDYIYKRGKWHNWIDARMLASEYYVLVERTKYWDE